MEDDFFSNWYLLRHTYNYIPKRLFRKTLSNLMQSVSADRVLDVGCGRSPYQELFPDSTYIGLDLSTRFDPPVVAKGQRLPIRSDSIDFVFCSEVIEHVFEFRDVIQEIRRVLRDDGKLLLTAPMGWGLHKEPHDFWRFTPHGLRQVLEEEEFEIEKVKKIGGGCSLYGGRFVEETAVKIHNTWLPQWLPHKFRRGTSFAFSIPFSLLFAGLAKLFDNVYQSDYISTAVLAVKEGE